jgi:hypothetical protein
VDTSFENFDITPSQMLPRIKGIDLVDREIVLSRNGKESQKHGSPNGLHSWVTQSNLLAPPHPDK